jgi:hypothetical protein
MASWPAKDPDAVKDYVYRIPLDAGDSIAAGQATVTKLAGNVSLDSYSPASAPDTTAEGYGQDVTVWLSGGTDGETAVFRVAWTTVDTRHDDDVITIAVLESDIVPLVLTGYAKPSAAHLIMKYPAFGATPPATVAFWLKDAERYVTTVWGESDYAAGLMALAAHNMAMAGLGSDTSALAGIPAGVTAMKSGSLSLNFTPEAANARLGGGLDASRYGTEYMALLRRNRAGPLVTGTGMTSDGIISNGWPYGLA